MRLHLNEKRRNFKPSWCRDVKPETKMIYTEKCDDSEVKGRLVKATPSRQIKRSRCNFKRRNSRKEKRALFNLQKTGEKIALSAGSVLTGGAIGTAIGTMGAVSLPTVGLLSGATLGAGIIIGGIAGSVKALVESGTNIANAFEDGTSSIPYRNIGDLYKFECLHCSYGISQSWTERCKNMEDVNAVCKSHREQYCIAGNVAPVPFAGCYEGGWSPHVINHHHDFHWCVKAMKQ